MANLVALLVDALWLVGMAGLLATVSFAAGERSGTFFVSLATLAQRRLLLPAALSLSLAAIGGLLVHLRGATSGAAWLLAAFGLLSALSITLVISALRSPSRAGAEFATPGRPTP